MKVFVFCISSLLSSFAFAAGFGVDLNLPANCPEKYEVFDKTQVQMTPGSVSCYVTVHPRDSYIDLIYRDFLFDGQGLFMVFNSYGPGPESQTTAAREFYFFPRDKAVLGYQYDAATKQLAVTNTNGKVFVFDTNKAVLVSISGSTIKQDYEIKPDNGGGIEITANDGLLMDGGFQMGQSPSQDPKDKLTFKDPRGNSCEMKNSEIYRYTSDSDVIFKYTDVQLNAFLKKRCPNLGN
jgi:hypothetical protein